MLAKYKSQLY